MNLDLSILADAEAAERIGRIATIFENLLPHQADIGWEFANYTPDEAYTRARVLAKYALAILAFRRAQQALESRSLFGDRQIGD